MTSKMKPIIMESLMYNKATARLAVQRSITRIELNIVIVMMSFRCLQLPNIARIEAIDIRMIINEYNRMVVISSAKKIILSEVGALRISGMGVVVALPDCCRYTNHPYAM